MRRVWEVRPGDAVADDLIQVRRINVEVAEISWQSNARQKGTIAVA